MIPNRNGPVILLVEDNQMDVELTQDAFRQLEIDKSLHVARTGEQALSYLKGEAAFADRQINPSPDIILLDLKLPGIGGLEVLARIKSTPVIKRIPVIVLTSSREEGDLVTSYEHGANSYLTKPITFKDFLAVANNLKEYWLKLNVIPPL